MFDHIKHICLDYIDHWPPWYCLGEELDEPGGFFTALVEFLLKT